MLWVITVVRTQSESRMRENLTSGSTRGRRKHRWSCAPPVYSTVPEGLHPHRADGDAKRRIDDEVHIKIPGLDHSTHIS